MKVSMTVNGVAVSYDVEPRTLLVQYLRDNLGLTGTHVGCDTSSCGACTLIVNGEAVKSCSLLAAQCEGISIERFAHKKTFRTLARAEMALSISSSVL